MLKQLTEKYQRDTMHVKWKCKSPETETGGSVFTVREEKDAEDRTSDKIIRCKEGCG